ncbi:hypothetical protein [Thermomonospora cellulosilytica]|uniref:Uncharacterized protein n=1 Tax=Thermomonospora cellulosilytica TaxID=1411118 RepID=A0A7W3R8L5_9ACTN|nr:hypothetical protein [Thermomonospora cellulosilytica]MBA9003704.1 hypothetical protein [Thermomonospora cellulosilytica]
MSPDLLAALIVAALAAVAVPAAVLASLAVDRRRVRAETAEIAATGWEIRRRLPYRPY